MPGEVKTVTFINNSRNPRLMINSAGAKVLVQIGEPVEVSAAAAIKVAKIQGFVDAAKYLKASAAAEDLKKENEALKKENEGLKKDLEKSKK